MGAKDTAQAHRSDPRQPHSSGCAHQGALRDRTDASASARWWQLYGTQLAATQRSARSAAASASASTAAASASAAAAPSAAVADEEPRLAGFQAQLAAEIARPGAQVRSVALRTDSAHRLFAHRRTTHQPTLSIHAETLVANSASSIGIAAIPQQWPFAAQMG
jgi:hypothetical protein